MSVGTDRVEYITVALVRTLEVMNASESDAPTRSVDYSDLSATLEFHHIGITAAEAHGIICGRLCSGACTDDIDSCYKLIVGPKAASTKACELHSVLRELHRLTWTELEDDQFNFRLLLPADDCTLTERTEAVTDWCRGFALGLMSNGDYGIDGLPGDAPELVRDIMQISEAEAGAEDPEGQERALVEIEEYVRAAVQLIYEELNHRSHGYA